MHKTLSGVCLARQPQASRPSGSASLSQMGKVRNLKKNSNWWWFAGTDFHICSLPHDSGSCDRKEFRYFYNSLERRCKLFVYGGCKGNQVEYLPIGQKTFTLDLNHQNNFLSEIDCVRRCGDKAAIDALALPELGPTPSLPEIGNLPPLFFSALLLPAPPVECIESPDKIMIIDTKFHWRQPVWSLFNFLPFWGCT